MLINIFFFLQCVFFLISKAKQNNYHQNYLIFNGVHPYPSPLFLASLIHSNPKPLIQHFQLPDLSSQLLLQPLFSPATIGFELPLSHNFRHIHSQHRTDE